MPNVKYADGDNFQFFPCSSSAEYPWSAGAGASRSSGYSHAVDDSAQSSTMEPSVPSPNAGAGASRHSSSPSPSGHVPATFHAAGVSGEFLEGSSDTERENGNFPDNTLHAPSHGISASASHSTTDIPSRSSVTLEASRNGNAIGNIQEGIPGRPEDAIDYTTQDLEPFLPHHYFDYVAGTSTGG